MLMQAFAALPRTLKTGVAVTSIVFSVALAWFVLEGMRSARLETGAYSLMSASRKYELSGSLSSLHQAMVVFAQQAALQPQSMGPDWDAWMGEHLKRMRSDLATLKALSGEPQAAPGASHAGEGASGFSIDSEIYEIAVGLERHLTEVEAKVAASAAPPQESQGFDALSERALKALSIAEIALAESPVLQRLIELSRARDQREREALLLEHQSRYSRSVVAMAAMLLMGYLSLIALLIAVVNANSASAARDQAVRERLAADEQRAQAVQAKIQFLRMVSHELRTPLQTLYSASDTLESALKGTSLAPTLRRLRAAARQLQTQIGDLSQFARSSETGLRIEQQPTDILELLRSIASSCEESARAKGLSLVSDFHALPATVQTDTARLWQILTNLLENAIKYTDKGEVKLGAGYAKGRLILTVADTGRGIPPEAQAQIWEPFYRVVGTSQDVPGTGLGLAIVKRLVESLDGEIQVSSAPGRGTVFTVRVPAAELEKRAVLGAGFNFDDPPISAPGELTRPNTRNVLIVGGNDPFRLALSRLLESLGENWVAEEQPDQALRQARQTRFDLVLVDLPSAGPAGRACAAALRREKLLAKGGRIVAIDDAMPGETAPPPEGFDRVVSKPVKLVTLRQMLDG